MSIGIVIIYIHELIYRGIVECLRYLISQHSCFSKFSFLITLAYIMSIAVTMLH